MTWIFFHLHACGSCVLLSLEQSACVTSSVITSRNPTGFGVDTGANTGNLSYKNAYRKLEYAESPRHTLGHSGDDILAQPCVQGSQV